MIERRMKPDVQNIGITQTEVQTAEDPSTLVPAGRTEITHTGYDAAYISESQFDPLFHPEHLRGRVSYSWVKDMSSDAHYRAATFYSYDAHGNVKTLFHDYHEGAMEDAGNAFKRMDYEYDLISGKVKEVAYQPGQPDQFYHRYSYDGENRLKTVETSRDGILWQRDARYGYYKHGPLARLELGDLGVQGLDYAYTLQGWLKGVNSTSVGDGSYDMGEDGKTGSANSLVARDAYGMSLNYFEGDYEPISSNVTPFAGVGSLTGTGNDLFNGNIASSVVNIPKLGEAKIYGYRYDQLNRLAAMDAYEGLNNAANSFTPVGLNDYKERFSYSPDGSILTLQRNGQGSNVIDNATWNYYPGTHRLEHIDDPAGRHGFDAGVQGADNYTYSPVGEMTSDAERGLTNISWTVYGKVQEQQLSDGRRINYTYDGGGNRISKQVSGSANANDDYTEWYVRDAGGNILSIYRKTDVLRQTVLYKYGGSLLGIKHHTVNMEEAPAGDGITPFIAGEDEYYVNDHRGNNMLTVSDTRTQHDEDQDGIVDYYTANIVTAQDYSSYGSLLEGRQYGNVPRHTYNGKELDKETGWQDYGMRPYLVDVPVFGKVDPIAKSYPELTPYQFASNTPIQAIDLDGCEAQAVIGFFVGAIIEIGQQTIANGFENISNGRSFFDDWGNNIDWADVGVAAVAGAINSVLPGAGEVPLYTRTANYVAVETFGNYLKSGIDVKGKVDGTKNIFDGSKNWNEFSKDMMSNSAGSLVGSSVPLTGLAKRVTSVTKLSVTREIGNASAEAALSIPRGGMTQYATGIIVGEIRRPIVSPPPPAAKPATKPQSKPSSKSPEPTRINFSYMDKNGQTITGDVPDNDYGHKELKKIEGNKDYKTTKP